MQVSELHAKCSVLSGEIYHVDENVSTWQSLQGYTVIDVQTAQKETHVAYLVLMQGRNLFVVFRGTQGLKDMFTDIQYKPLLLETSPVTLHVHVGIFKATERSISMMQEKLLAVAQKDPGIENLIFTGHSLGGAAAMAARLIVLMKGWKLATAHHVVSFGAPLFFNGDVSLRHPYVQQIHSESHCYVHDTDLFPRLLGAKDESWKRFFSENNDLFKKYGKGIAVMGAAALTAATCATGGIATAVFFGAGAMIGAKASQESAKHGMSLQDSGVIKMIVKGLSSKSLDDVVVQAYREVGQFYQLDASGALAILQGTAARRMLQIPTASLLYAVAAHKMHRYQEKLIALSPMAGKAVLEQEDVSQEDY